MAAVVAASRKQVAFGMRALAAAGVVRDTLWSGISFFDTQQKTLTLSAMDGDAANMSPLDTRKVAKSRGAPRGVSGMQHTGAALYADADHIELFALLHESSGANCCVVVSNTRASWLAAQPPSTIDCALPAFDLNCAMIHVWC